MKLHANFAALYGWCPSIRGLSRGEIELGLLANMTNVNARENLGMAQAIGAAFSGEVFADMAEVAGVPERVVNRIRMQAVQDKMQGQN